MLHGKHNSGPAQEVWRLGDRVCLDGQPSMRGWVRPPRRERNAGEQHMTWVEWDDRYEGFINPNRLDIAI